VRIALATTLWLLAACLPALADLRIRSSPGGEVGHYLALFMVMRQSGERVIIDGPCLSACTLVLSVLPRERICVTRRAVFGFHAAREVGRKGRLLPASEATRLIAATYPEPVQAWIERHGGLSRHLLLLKGEELTQMYPSCR
jgi:hypothetical protein